MRAPSRAAASASTPEADAPVAGHAGVRACGPRGSPATKSSTTPAPEALGHVEGEVRDAEGVRAGARQPDGLGRAAGALGGGRGGVVPEAHRHADHVEAGVAQQHRRDGAVDAAAHRHRDALGAQRHAAAARGGAENHASSARATASSTSSGPWRRSGPRPPRSASRSPRREAQRLVERARRPGARRPRWRPPWRRRSRRPGSAPRARGRPRMRSAMRTRSPHAALPDSPTASGPSIAPAPAGDARWRIASGG